MERIDRIIIAEDKVKANMKNENQDEFWSEGYFAESVSSSEMKKKERTFPND